MPCICANKDIIIYKQDEPNRSFTQHIFTLCEDRWGLQDQSWCGCCERGDLLQLNPPAAAAYIFLSQNSEVERSSRMLFHEHVCDKSFV